MTELNLWDLVWALGPITFVMVWCHVDSKCREWIGEGKQHEEFDIFEHRQY